MMEDQRMTYTPEPTVYTTAEDRINMLEPTGYATAEDLTNSEVIVSEDFETMTGRKIRIRGLSRAQVLVLRQMDASVFEAHMLVAAIAAPKLTVAQAQAWMENAPGGEIEEVNAKISRLSGMDDDAGKQAYKSVRIKR